MGENMINGGSDEVAAREEYVALELEVVELGNDVITSSCDQEHCVGDGCNPYSP